MTTPATTLARLQATTGIACVIIALLLNPWVVENYIARDGSFDQKTLLMLAEAGLLLAGIALLATTGYTRSLKIDPQTARLGTAAFLFSIGVAIVIAELTVRIAVPPQQLFLADEDGWWLLRWQQAQANLTEENLTPEGFGFDQYDPDYGWSTRANFSSPDIRTNSQGVRADREYNPEPSADVIRIVIVGDSFTWGEDVANEFTYPAQLEQVLPNVEVINLGVHGSGTDQQLLTLKNLGLDWKPDLVILGFYEGNMDRNALSFRDFGKPRYELKDGKLQLTNHPVPNRDEYLKMKVELPSFRLGKLVSKVWQTGIRATKFYPPLTEWPRWQVTREIFNDARNLANGSGAEFMLVHIGDSESVRPAEMEPAIGAWAEDTSTRFLNLSDVFRAREDGDWNKIYQGHLTNYGNRVAAEAIADYLQRTDGLHKRITSP